MPPATDAGAVECGRHLAHFYSDEDELADTAAGFIAEGLREDGRAMIVATSEHLRAFGEALGRAGIDLAARRDAGTCMTVDAEDAMRELIVDGKPDRDRFDATVGGAIRAATADGRPLSVVGELVSLLWEAGNLDGVIEFEELWDELGRELPLRTLCVYRLDAVSNAEDVDVLREVCRLHTYLISLPFDPESPPGPVSTARTRSFPGDSNSPRAARRFVTTTLQALGADDLVDDAAVVVTELAANAVLHARGGFTVAVSHADGAIRIEVREKEATLPRSRATRLVARPGHGLGIVAARASAWGSAPRTDGRVSWAELRRAI